MTVTEALKILQLAPKEQPRFTALLACGFTPLHLQLFLNARLQERLPARLVQVSTGLYGDLAGSLEGAAVSDVDAVGCAIEWPDLDPRLGYRESANWGLSAVTDIANGARAMLDRLRSALDRLPTGIRVALCTPTLPIPPAFHTVGWQASRAELALEESLSQFAASAAERRGTIVVNARRLQENSPASGRLDLKSDLATGLPYTLAHADVLAATLARLLLPASPIKGIITDLDDTLWRGIVGDVGPENVSWDLASHHRVHGLYQQLLASLAEAGVLIAIASKNDPAVVQKALQREDLLLRPDQVFPMEVHWEAKSGSVQRILQTWNIGADAVVFVDDSPMELAEVAAVHPGIRTVPFPTQKPQAALEMLRNLRDLCGKEQVSGDDAIRLESIRRGADFHHESSAATPETFLQQAEATLTIDYGAGTEDARALELVNKTNQFNINGARYTEAEWKKALTRPGAFLLVISYADRFGPLGKIGVIQGRRERDAVVIETWVLSCRAFARRIEFQCLKLMFERFAAQKLQIEFVPTAKNGPARNLFAALTGQEPSGSFALSRLAFEEKCPALYHHVAETERVETNG